MGNRSKMPPSTRPLDPTPPQQARQQGEPLNIDVKPEQIINSFRNQIARMATQHAEQVAMLEGAIEQLRNQLNDALGVIAAMADKENSNGSHQAHDSSASSAG